MSDIHRPPTFADLVVTALRRSPRATAFVDRSGDLTYGAAHDRVMQLTRVLLATGIQRGDGVALLAGNVTPAWLAMAATLVAGGRYTALHPMGSVGDHAYILNDCRARVLVYDPVAYGEHVTQLSEQVEDVKFLALGPAPVGVDAHALADAQATGTLRAPVEANDLAALPYTGGTTGFPKGVMLSHRALVFNALQELADWQWPEHIRLLATTPITHGAGPLVVPTLLRGGTVVLDQGFSPDRFCDVVARHSVTATFLVPTMIYGLLDYLDASSDSVDSLRTVIYGASAMSPTRLEQGLDRLGQIFVQLYAQTEAPNTVCRLAKEDHDMTRAHLLASCGSPVLGIDVELRDGDDLAVGAGEVGEICVRGPLVMDGYWQNPQDTAATMRDGWLHTGDLATRDDEGYLYVVDRKKDMIITGGFNVYPREVEDVLSSHPAVASTAVIGVPDDKWGESVKAVVVIRPGHQVSAEELMALVKERKGSVVAPKVVQFVDELPLTGYGKPDKKALRAEHWAGQQRLVH